MSYGTPGPVTTTDNYGDASTIETDNECALVDIWVFGNPIYYSLKTPGGVLFGDDWDRDNYIPAIPNFWFLASLPRRATGIKFKSAIPGQAAQVIVQLIPSSQLPLDG